MSETPEPRWIFEEAGQWHEVPKGPLLAAGLSAPCSVALPNGAVRVIVVEGSDA